MASVFGGGWRLALVVASSLAAASGCGESFVAASGSGGDTGSGGTGATGGTATTGGTADGGGGTGGSVAACQSGDMQSCYTGPDGTLGKGVCTAGSQMCTPEGKWGDCLGDVVPAAETCDGQDNSCEGVVDEGCPCEDGDYCYPFGGEPGKGKCLAGTKVCKNGGLVECSGAVGPSQEMCNGLDDDCDGVEDDVEGLGNACDTMEQGVCAVGVQHCNLGQQVLECDAVNMPSEEICDGKDNDCNGKPDDVVFEACTLDVQTPEGTVSCGGVKACDEGGQLVCSPARFFGDDFSDMNAGGWNFGLEWSIGPATASPPPGQGNGDPGTDHSSTNDNGVAGVVIGGNPSQVSTLPSYLMSKSIDTAGYGSLYLSYWRWLNTSGSGNRPHTVEVSTNNGVSWDTIWENGQGAVFDDEWKLVGHSLMAYVGKTIRIRFGFAKINVSDPSVSSWNIDDLRVSSCPPGMPAPGN